MDKLIDSQAQRTAASKKARLAAMVDAFCKNARVDPGEDLTPPRGNFSDDIDRLRLPLPPQC